MADFTAEEETPRSGDLQPTFNNLIEGHNTEHLKQVHNESTFGCSALDQLTSLVNMPDGPFSDTFPVHVAITQQEPQSHSPMTLYERLIDILDHSIGGPEEEIGVHGAFWRGLTRDEFVVKRGRGLNIVTLGDGVKRLACP